VQAAPNSDITEAMDADTIRAAICNAMIGGGHETAGSLFEAGTWDWDGNELRVKVGASKTLLGLVYTTHAQQIVRDRFRQLTGSGRAVKVEPGEAPANANGKTTVKQIARDSVSGDTRPQDHPLIRHAQELFRAEVRSVVSLRDPR
jgi:DNA polymerase-3 subunit gamma/tau